MTPERLSVSQIWVVADDNDDLNSIEAGWEVHPPRYGDYQTRFFILWTMGTYENHCMNLECPGFVQTSSDVSLGCNFTEMSTFNGNRKDVTFSIYKWKFLNTNTRYSRGILSKFLFIQLAKTAGDVEFGGEIYDEKYKERHSKTKIGNDYFPLKVGFGISIFFNHVQVIDENNKAKDPEDVETYVSNRNSYDLKVDEKHTNGYGFYYGGLGYNNNFHKDNFIFISA